MITSGKSTIGGGIKVLAEKSSKVARCTKGASKMTHFLGLGGLFMRMVNFIKASGKIRKGMVKECMSSHSSLASKVSGGMMCIRARPK
jgi:hypothetical protein